MWCHSKMWIIGRQHGNNIIDGFDSLACISNLYRGWMKCWRTWFCRFNAVGGKINILSIFPQCSVCIYIILNNLTSAFIALKIMYFSRGKPERKWCTMCTCTSMYVQKPDYMEVWMVSHSVQLANIVVAVECRVYTSPQLFTLNVCGLYFHLSAFIFSTWGAIIFVLLWVLTNTIVNFRLTILSWTKTTLIHESVLQCSAWNST